MRQKFAILLFIFLVGVFEISLFSNLFPSQTPPDLLLIMVIIWSARKYFKTAWIWSGIAGLVLDFLTFRTIGVGALFLIIISLGAEFLGERFFVVQRTRAFLMIAFFVLGGTIINYFFWDLAFQGGFHKFPNLFFKISVNLIAYPFIYWLTFKLKNILQNDEGKLIMK